MYAHFLGNDKGYTSYFASKGLKDSGLTYMKPLSIKSNTIVLKKKIKISAFLLELIEVFSFHIIYHYLPSICTPQPFLQLDVFLQTRNMTATAEIPVSITSSYR